MTVIRLTKEFDFEMAHALLGYDGPCKNIHGHSYKLKVTIKGNVKNDTTNSDEGMVIDFGVIKRIVKTNIVDVFDHALVLNEKSNINANELPFANKFIKTPFQPTCENMLPYFAQIIKKELPNNIKLHSLFLRETPTSYAEWFADDN